MTLIGNDVSGYQQDWTPPKDHTFVFIKATEGRTFTSPGLGTQIAKARKAGLQVGFYHFLHPGNAEAQADYFLSRLSLQAGDLLVCDWETTNDGHPSVPDAAAFLARLKLREPQHKSGLYCNLSDWNSTAVKAGDFLWLAAYRPAKPVITHPISFWQFTDKPIDTNYGYFDSADALKKWALELVPSKPPITPVPVTPLPPRPKPKPAEEEIMYSPQYKTNYVRWRGGYFAPITVAKLSAIPTAVRVTQGGLSYAPASAMTHAGIGAFDLNTDGMTKAEVWKLSEELGDVNIIAFPRGFNQDSFQGPTIGNTNDGNEHLHCIDRDCYNSLHQEAKDQVNEFLRGGDGLVGNAPYFGPPRHLQKWADSQYNPANVKQIRGVFYVVVDSLYGLGMNRDKKDIKHKGDGIGFQKQVRRWGRWNIVDSRGIYWAINDGGKTKYLTATAPNKKPQPAAVVAPASFKPGTYVTRSKTNAHKRADSASPVSITVPAGTKVEIASFAGKANGHNWVKDKVVKDRFWNLDVLNRAK